MKRLVLVFIVLFVSLTGINAQSDTVYSQEGNEITKQVTTIINKTKIQEGLDVSFDDSEMKQLDNGEVVKKEKGNLMIPIKLIPVIQLAAQTKISSFKQGDDGVVRKTGETFDLLYPKKSWGLTVIWMFVPFICIFILAYLSIENKETGRNNFIVFALVTTVTLVAMIIIGVFFGVGFGLSFGTVIGLLIGSIFGFLILEKKSLLGLLFGLIIGLCIGFFIGIFAGQFDRIFEPLILWQYVLLYLGVCFLAFLFREAIVRRQNKLLANE